MPDLKEKVIDKNNIDNPTELTTTLSFDEKVIKKIVGFSIAEIPGILAMSGNFIAGLTDMLRSSEDPTKGITVELGKKQVAISMKIICEYGKNIPVIFQDIVEKVGSAIREMTGLEVIDVKVHVYDILTKEDFERQSKKKSDEKIESGGELLESSPPKTTSG